MPHSLRPFFPEPLCYATAGADVAWRCISRPHMRMIPLYDSFGDRDRRCAYHWPRLFLRDVFELATPEKLFLTMRLGALGSVLARRHFLACRCNTDSHEAVRPTASEQKE